MAACYLFLFLILLRVFISAGDSDKSLEIQDANERRTMNIAQEAAEEAKEASEMMNIAAAQASRQIKAQLAQKALTAAKEANTILAGKQAIVSRLEQEIKEAKSVVEEQAASLRDATNLVGFAMLASKQAAIELKVLSEAFRNLSHNVGAADRASQSVQRDFIEKKQLVKAAKNRIMQIEQKAKRSKMDLENTKQAVIKAHAAAEVARINLGRGKRKVEDAN